VLARLPHRVKHWVIPLLRTCIRYGPDFAVRRALWTRVVEPYFAWEAYPFVAATVFGSRMAGNTNEILQQYVYYFGLWEPHITEWIRRLLRPGDGFIDVGANTGYYSLLASRLVGAAGTVVAIEASPKTFARLRENLDRNRARNVRAVNLAAAAFRGWVPLFAGPDENTGLATVLAARGLAFDCNVEAAPLCEILRPEEIRAARLIKIDVEGAEADVVEGIGPLLTTGRPDLEVLVEIHAEYLAQQGKHPDDVLRPFRHAGFHAYALENDYTSWAYLSSHTPKPPERIRTAIDRETNVVLSRQDADRL
jgi:FkbM family methyltransferase